MSRFDIFSVKLVVAFEEQVKIIGNYNELINRFIFHTEYGIYN